MTHSEILRDRSFIHLTQIPPPHSKEIVVGRCPLKYLNQSQSDTVHAEAATGCHHHSLARTFISRSQSRLDEARIEEEAENGDKKEHLYMLQVVVDIISVSAALLALIALLVYIIKRYLSSE